MACRGTGAYTGERVPTGQWAAGRDPGTRAPGHGGARLVSDPARLLSARPRPRRGSAPPAMAAVRALLAAAAVAAWVLGVASGPIPPPRSASVLLEPGSGRLRVLPGRQPAAVAWAELTDHIQAVG